MAMPLSAQQAEDLGLPPVKAAPAALSPEQAAALGLPPAEPVPDQSLGVHPMPPAPDVEPTDPAIVGELHTRMVAKRAGEKLPQPSASLAAFRASNAKLTPDEGAEALQHADTTGLGPTYVAKNLDAVRGTVDANKTKASLEQAPATAAWMNQGPAHAAAAPDDLEPLGPLEWIFGPDAPPPPPAPHHTRPSPSP